MGNYRYNSNSPTLAGVDLFSEYRDRSPSSGLAVLTLNGQEPDGSGTPLDCTLSGYMRGSNPFVLSFLQDLPLKVFDEFRWASPRDIMACLAQFCTSSNPLRLDAGLYIGPEEQMENGTRVMEENIRTALMKRGIKIKEGGLLIPVHCLKYHRSKGVYGASLNIRADANILDMESVGNYPFKSSPPKRGIHRVYLDWKPEDGLYSFDMSTKFAFSSPEFRALLIPRSVKGA
jgi:hypothetical protein